MNSNRNDLPVLLLYDLDPAWSDSEAMDRCVSVHHLKNALGEVGHPVQEVRIQRADLTPELSRFNHKEYLVLNWCEGFPGNPRSDSLVAESLEKLGFTFTGASAQTLTFSQDKRLVKLRLQEYDIPTPTWQIYYKPNEVDWNRFPAIVKPAYEHCSIGITRESVVQTKQELTARVNYIFESMNEPAMVEEFIDGREFHVGVIGNGNIKVLPPVEIDYSSFYDIHDRLCTYESKFDKSSLAYQVTAPKGPVALAYKKLHLIKEVAASAFRAIGCRDYARMDIRLRDGIFYLLDVNPNADIGFENNLVFGAKLAGLSYGEFGSLLVNLASTRHPSLMPVCN
jgi:D-alanine-D-alanine ligase